MRADVGDDVMHSSMQLAASILLHLPFFHHDGSSVLFSQLFMTDVCVSGQYFVYKTYILFNEVVCIVTSICYVIRHVAIIYKVN